MKKLFVFTLLPAAVLGAAFVFLSPKDLPAPTVTLAEARGFVQYQAASAETWTAANAGMELHEGDAVKTGADGQAAIIFHDSSSSRLGQNAEILIENASLNDKSQIIGIRLTAGRVWSRILKLLDKDTSFEVRTSSTVATVRGTTLDVAVDEAEKTTVAVAEGVVDVAVVETERATDEKTGKPRFKIARKFAEVKVEKDKMVEIPKTKAETSAEVKIAVQEIREEMKKADWFQNNTRKDGEFEKQAKKNIHERVKQEGGILPDSPFYQLKRATENISLILPAASEKKQKLIEKIAARRLKETVLMNKDASPEIEKEIREAVRADIKSDEAVKEAIPAPIEAKTVQPKTPVEQPKPADQEKIQTLQSSFEQLGDLYARIILLAENAKIAEAKQLLDQFRLRAEKLTGEALPFMASNTELRTLVEQMKEYLTVAKLQITHPVPTEPVLDDTFPIEETPAPLP